MKNPVFYGIKRGVLGLVIKLSGQSEDDFILDSVRQLSSREPSEEIWNPIGE